MRNQRQRKFTGSAVTNSITHRAEHDIVIIVTRLATANS